ncbi:acetylglutamate kinase [Robertkochia solimangrovi]|uniref:acetylglutamate kinase n=1 Tax=Robertkochia solimangrovi TaxID=2213046 RepID=UPI00117F71C2|nr:acetylglutamate kinase [Robertkochia solimangrovi]TRZ42539.1 acetylglutamate kinase [Robertkochia solimangrovi]
MKVTIVKIGGNLIENQDTLQHFLDDFSAIQGPKVLIHGGGKLATNLAETMGIPVHMVDGRRITDGETLKVITMVYGGLVNKSIVAGLQARSCNATGVSGADLNLITSVKRPVKTHDFGFVGDVTAVDEKMLTLLLEHEITPVCCAITHDGKGQLFNTNADTIATEIAVALSKQNETELYYCFEKKGVLKNINDEDSVIRTIDTESYEELKAAGIIADGMLPKLHNCFDALNRGVNKVYIGNIEMLRSKESIKTTITL